MSLPGFRTKEKGNFLQAMTNKTARLKHCFTSGSLDYSTLYTFNKIFA